MSTSLPSTKYQNTTRTVAGIVEVEDSDLVLNCDTSLAAVTINLKEIPANYWSTLYKLYIKDLSGNALTNNITIVAPTGFKINNQQSLIINVNSGSALVRIGSNTDYIGELNYSVTGSTAIVVQNTVYVMKNGSDTTGLAERFDRPFLTFAAARAAAVALTPSATKRIRIIVESGTYMESIDLANYVDWDLGDSIVDGADFAHATIDDYTTFSGGVDSIIYGCADIRKSNFAAGSDRDAVLIRRDTTNLTIYCKKISSAVGNAILAINGNLLVRCDTIQASVASYDAVGIAGNTATDKNVIIYADKIISNTNGVTISTGRVGDVVAITAREIIVNSASGCAVSYVRSGPATINAARLVNTNAAGNAVTISGDGLILKDCVLVTQGANESIVGTATKIVKLYGTNISNNVNNAGIVLQVGTLTVDANVT